MENFYNLILNIPLNSSTKNDVELSPPDADMTQTELFEENIHALPSSIWTCWWNTSVNIKYFKRKKPKKCNKQTSYFEKSHENSCYVSEHKLTLKLLCEKGTSPDSLHFLRFTISAMLKQQIWSQIASSGGQPNF